MNGIYKGHSPTDAEKQNFAQVFICFLPILIIHKGRVLGVWVEAPEADVILTFMTSL